MPPVAGLAARTVRGIEWVAAEEIDATLPGARDLRLAPRQVTFTVPADCVADATRLRTVDDVFVRVGILLGVGRDRAVPAQLARAVGRLDLAAALAVVHVARPVTGVGPGGALPLVDVVASLDRGRRFSRFDVEDAAGPEVAAALGATYVSRREGTAPPTDLSLRVAIAGDRAEVLLRLAARPLHRRAWKAATGAGTLHPPAAAALVRLAGRPAMVIDPCCGDGTIVVEAALAGARALGGDIDRGRLEQASGNARRAGTTISLLRADGGALPIRSATAASVVTNPPWNRTVDAAGALRGSLEPLWAEAARLVGGHGTLALVAEPGEGAAVPERGGWHPLLRQQLRLAGRVVDLAVLGRGGAALDPVQERWRARAIAEGITTDTGF